MIVDVKNLKTGEIEYELLEVTDIMHGAFTGDDRYIVFLPGGQQLIFSPMEDYLIGVHVEPPSEPPVLPEPTPDYIAFVAGIMEGYGSHD